MTVAQLLLLVRWGPIHKTQVKNIRSALTSKRLPKSGIPWGPGILASALEPLRDHQSKQVVRSKITSVKAAYLT